MATRMQQRRGTAAQWTAANPVLAAGEIGFETDTNQFKIGDGSSLWSTISYFKNLEDLGGLDDFTLISREGVANGVATLNSSGHIPISQLGSIIANAPSTLDTLQELASYVTTLDGLVSDHNIDTTSVHGIANTADLTTTSQVSTAVSAAITAHQVDTTDVHGIANTADLATTSQVSTAVSAAVSTHQADTTDVHGIANTADLATQAFANNAVTTHSDDTTSVHGIPNTALLETMTGAQAKADAAQAAAISAAATDANTKVGTETTNRTTAISAHNSLTQNVHGIADTTVLVTQTQLTNAVNGAEVDQSALAGTGLLWDSINSEFDVDNTYITTATQTALDLKAPLASPTFTGTISGITKTMVGLGSADNTADTAKPVSTAQATAIATAKAEAIADATSQVNALLTGAPAALNTLDELAAALGDDENFASTVTTSLGLKAPLASPTFTGTVTVAANGIVFTDGTQTKAGVPSITNIPTAIAAGTHELAAGRADQFIPLTGAVVITLPATGYSTGQSIDFYQESGTGASFASTNSVVGTPGRNFRTTNSVVTAMKTASGWLVFGDLSA